MAARKVPSDLELVRKAKAGDQDAFGELMLRNEAKVYGLCLKMLGNQEDAEDCLQESFIKAYKALPRFREESRFSTWLYRIAYNESLMRIRKKKLDTVSLDRPVEMDEGDVTRELADWTNDPRADVMNNELSDILVQHINELDPDNRIVFILRDVHGLSTGDTAEALGLSVPAVKSRLHRARLFLRQRLSDYFELSGGTGDTSTGTGDG
jgi:RNA polymerase sigma-70 factor (ECF subfamily)